MHFAVRKFVKSHNKKSFIELACSVRIGKILVSFYFWKFMDLPFGLFHDFQKKEVDQWLPNTDLTPVQ